MDLGDDSILFLIELLNLKHVRERSLDRSLSFYLQYSIIHLSIPNSPTEQWGLVSYLVWNESEAFLSAAST